MSLRYRAILVWQCPLMCRVSIPGLKRDSYILALFGGFRMSRGADNQRDVEHAFSLSSDANLEG